MRKPAICIYAKTKVQIKCCNRTADQRLCFRYIDSTIPLLSKSEISQFVSDLVRNPEDPFSHNEAHIVKVFHTDVEKAYLAKKEAAAEALGGGEIDDLSELSDGDDGGGDDILPILGGGDCTLMGDPGADWELNWGYCCWKLGC